LHPPHCSTAGDYRALYQMLLDLGLYLGPIEPGRLNSSALDAACRFAKSKGIEFAACQGVITAEFCRALIDEWESRFGTAAAAARIREHLGRRHVALMVPGMEEGAVAEPAPDPIAMCQAGGGTWDYMANTCLMKPAGFWEGLSPAAKYGLIGGVLVVLGVAGYGIYAATR
jgi:hypothetical protein